MVPGLFVVGTDTGVGKTLVACALIRLLREHGVDAVGFKPVATGLRDGRWHDADALYAASGGTEPLEHLCPMRFKAPMAPVQAARREGILPDISLAQSALTELAGRHALVVAEGIGGLLVPLDPTCLVLDFVKRSLFHTILVARAALGTVNHTLLSLRELERAEIPLAALILNVTHAADAENAEPSAEEIASHSRHRVTAVIPFLGGADEAEAPPTTEVARAIARLTPQLHVMKLIEGLQA